MGPRATPTGRAVGIAALLFTLTLALHWRASSFAFLAYDDDTYVTANEGVRGGLSWAGLRWAFTTAHAANWHPLTWLSHQLDVQLFGLDAGAHHRTSVVLHALNAALAFLALRALTGATWRSAFAAAFFALHPLRVESVAWVAERKDLLAGACALGALWAYAGYARRGCAGRYGLSLALFALGLAAKPMLVTLPFVLLLLDRWPLERTGRRPWSALVLEKAPFLLLAALSSAVTLAVQRAGGAFGPLDTVPFGARLGNAAASLAHYLEKTVAPFGLCAFHPHPALAEPPLPAWTALAGAGIAVLGLASCAGWRLRRSAPYLGVGFLWFVGMLVPVLGLLQVGLAGWAERYTYLPSLGLEIVFVWGAAELGERLTLRPLVLALAAGALAALSFQSARQLGVWRDSTTLFAHAIAVEDSVVARVNLGNALQEAGDLAGAEQHFARAVELRPSLAGPRVNLGRVLRERERPAEALASFTRAVECEPDLPEAQAELGWLLCDTLGQDAAGLEHLRRAVALAPDELDYRNNVAWVLATSATAAAPEESRVLAEALVREGRGNQLGYLETLAAALARLGRFDEAARLQARVLERVPERFREPVAARARLYAERKPFVKSP